MQVYVVTMTEASQVSGVTLLDSRPQAEALWAELVGPVRTDRWSEESDLRLIPDEDLAKVGAHCMSLDGGYSCFLVTMHASFLPGVAGDTLGLWRQSQRRLEAADEVNLGPVLNPDGSPTETTLEMLRGSAGCACGPNYATDHAQCRLSPTCDGCDGHPFDCA